MGKLIYCAHGFEISIATDDLFRFQIKQPQQATGKGQERGKMAAVTIPRAALADLQAALDIVAPRKDR